MIGPVALILPFHSDSERLAPALKAFAERPRELNIVEAILAHNGGECPKFVAPPDTRLLHSDAPGIGAGYALGIENAKAEWVLLSASDLPFGFSDLANARRGLGSSIFIGSKFHPDSQSSNHGNARLALGKIFYLWRRLFFGKGTPRDSQGTLLMRRELAMALLPEVRSRDFLFSAELLYRAQSRGLSITEVPVTVNESKGKSSVRPIRHGIRLFVGVLYLRFTRKG